MSDISLLTNHPFHKFLISQDKSQDLAQNTRSQKFTTEHNIYTRKSLDHRQGILIMGGCHQVDLDSLQRTSCKNGLSLF